MDATRIKVVVFIVIYSSKIIKGDFGPPIDIEALIDKVCLPPHLRSCSFLFLSKTVGN